MCASRTKKWVVGVVFLGLVTVVAIPVLAAPQLAVPPLGIWSGSTSDGTVVTLFLAEDGSYTLAGMSPSPIGGTWTWAPRTRVAGILNLAPEFWPKHPIAAYTVVWLGANRIELSSDSFKVVLHPMS
jgi:hypothetical protein